MSKYESLYEDFGAALGRFEEVLRLEKTDVVRDSAIKRFELVFDLAWKTVKAYLEEEHNAPCASPRQCYREAFRVGVLDYDAFWISVTSESNYTAHAYSEVLAEKIYAGLPNSLAHFKKLSATLRKTTR